MADARKVESLSPVERLDLLLVHLLPSDEEDWDEDLQEEEVSPGSKENKPANGEPPNKKRKRIIIMDSDDSADDETFAPSKKVKIKTLVEHLSFYL